MLAALVALPLVVSAVAMLPFVQNVLVDMAARRLSADLGTEVSIRSARLLPFSGVRVGGILLRDQNADTLVYVESIRFKIEKINFRDRQLHVGTARVNSPVANVVGQNGEFNFSFIQQQQPAPPDSITPRWKYFISNLVVSNGMASLYNIPGIGMNSALDSLLFTGIGLEVSITQAPGGKFSVDIDNFSFKERAGLLLRYLSAKAVVANDTLSISDIEIATDLSAFKIPNLEIGLSEPAGGDNVPAMRCEIDLITLSTREVNLYLPGFPVFDDEIEISGLLYTSHQSLNGRYVTFQTGQNTRLVTTFDLDGLSNLNEALLYMDVESFQTSAADLELFFHGTGNVLPQFAGHLGVISYKGNITGFINDLVAFGSFSSNLGVVNTDVGIKFMPGNELIYAGLINAANFDIGRLFDMEPLLRQATFNLEISGNRRSATDYFLFMDGNIAAVEFNDYIYRNIVVQGLSRHQLFDGRVSINDPNGQLEFLGKVDMSRRVPHFNFNAQFSNVLLDRLNIMPDFEESALTFSMNTNFEGYNIDDLVGEIVFTNGLLFTPVASVDFDSLSVRASHYEHGKQLVLRSPFANGTVTGSYSFRNMRYYFYSFLSNYLPSFTPVNYSRTPSFNNDFVFDFGFDNISGVMSVLFPDIQIANNGHVRGHFTSNPASFEVEAAFDYLNYKGIASRDIELNARSTPGSNQLGLIFESSETSYRDLFTISNFTLHQSATNDTLETNLFWNNWDEVAYSGGIYTTTIFNVDKDGNRLTRLYLHPSALVVANTPWIINQASAMLHPGGFNIDGFRIGHNQQYITVDGYLHREEEDGIRMVIHDFQLANLLQGREPEDFNFSGVMNGDLVVRDFFREPLLASNLQVRSLNINQVDYGILELASNWDPLVEAVDVSLLLARDQEAQLQGQGLFHPGSQFVDFIFLVDDLGIGFLDPILSNVIQDLRGRASGKLFFKGPLQNPFFSGRVNLEEGSFSVDMLQASYSISDSVIFYPNEIRFRNMLLTDSHNRTGRFNGSIYHAGNFTGMVYDLQVEANNMLLLNTSHNDSPHFHGTVFGTALLTLSGDDDNFDINISGRTNPGTRFNIPIRPGDVAAESNFIRFTSNGLYQIAPGRVPDDFEYSVDLTGVRLDMNIEITPDAQVQIIFDGGAGDILRATGNGNVQVRIDRQGALRLYGDYTISEGDYFFSLQNLINKRFIINQGGTVEWSGDPGNAQVDITAVYRLKAPLNELVGPMATGGMENGNGLQRRVQIHCNLMLSGQLQQPAIRFGLEMPTLDDSREALVLDLISTEDELNRQVLSLLLLNRFYTPEHLRMTENMNSRQENAAIIATTTGMLSAQLSRWFSSVSRDVDIGFAYHPGDHLSQEEVEVALSTQVFNNRVTFNGNVGYGKYFTNTSNLVGDFDMEVKLNRGGSIRARAYTRSNESLVYEVSPTTQGIGLSFREEFNSFGELMEKYWRMITGRRDSL